MMAKKREKIPVKQPHDRIEEDPPREEDLWMVNEKIKGSHTNPSKAPVSPSVSQFPELTLAWLRSRCKFAANWYKPDSSKDFSAGYQAFLKRPSTHWSDYVGKGSRERDWSAFKDGWLAAEAENGNPVAEEKALSNWEASHPVAVAPADPELRLRPEPTPAPDPLDVMEHKHLAEEDLWNLSQRPSPKPYGQDPWRNQKNRGG
jgi:hypothetical protein